MVDHVRQPDQLDLIEFILHSIEQKAYGHQNQASIGKPIGSSVTYYFAKHCSVNNVHYNKQFANYSMVANSG